MDCRHSTGDDQRLWTVQEMTRDCGHSTGMTRDCGHSTGDDQRDCGHSTGDDQRLRTQYRR
ncbi:unnamed protein product [Staurois parvus]|uniref:Uncharacterized protein n=1 Tax=Staurois parvus TaxID=386267 RepID=A0ABN9CCC9_9NEOB|nr:unnamed protein product [Staurois parvus]